MASKYDIRTGILTNDSGGELRRLINLARKRGQTRTSREVCVPVTD